MHVFYSFNFISGVSTKYAKAGGDMSTMCKALGGNHECHLLFKVNKLQIYIFCLVGHRYIPNDVEMSKNFR